MNKLIVLGTGNGAALKCYNTCFVLQNKSGNLLVDGGGGNQVLSNLQKSNIDITSIHNVFVSHNHLDHIIGVVWVIRRIAIIMRVSNKYEGILNVYASKESIEGLSSLCDVLLSVPQKKYIGDRIIFNTIEDRQQLNILGTNITFIDIKAKKDTQFGFKLELDNDEYLSFLGDEPCNELIYDIAQNSKWLLHEAFCLEEQKDKYNPHEKGHCTVKEASETAKKLESKNLVLWHTEDDNLDNRKELYTKESKMYFNGNVFVPNDLDVIEL